MIATTGLRLDGFAGAGWRVLFLDVPFEAAGEVVVLEDGASADDVERLTRAGREVVVVVPERGFDRAVALANELARRQSAAVTGA